MNITKEQGVLIRGIAILMIVVYHFQYDMFGGSFLIERGQGVAAWIADSWFYINQEPKAAIGFLMSLCFIGVNVFFVLSGYALVKKYRDRGKVKMKDMMKQVLKVLIPYWLAHPLIHGIDWVLKNLQYQLGFIDYETHFAGMHSVAQYFESLLVFPRWFSNDGALAFVGTWWFVGIIVQFYLLFPLLLKLFKKCRPINALYLCVGLSLVYRLVVSLVSGDSPIGINEAEVLLFITFPARLSEFALGMYLAWEVNALKRLRSVSLAIGFIVLGFILLAYVPTMFVSDFLFGLGGIILICAVVQPLKGFLEKVVRVIGEKSYSIYLYHEPTMKLILKFIFPNWIN